MKLLITIILLFVAAVVYIRWIEMHSIFHPSKVIIAYPSDYLLEYEDVYFKTSDNVKLNGWLIKGTSGTTVLFFHGNGANISSRMGKLRMFHELGLTTLIVDYRGYGKSEGIPSELGLYRDAQAAYDYLLNRPEINKEKIVIYGESLGGAVAINLASKVKAAALVVDSSFTSAIAMGKLLYPMIPAFLVGFKFDSIVNITTISVPKLFLHSQTDDVVPWRLGQQLYKAAGEPKEFFEIRGTHNDAFTLEKELFYEGLRNFLKKYGLV
jgi:fermentation-respiration switch protein FrsA (DUF1100 family)